MNILLVVGERPDLANALAERLGILGVEAVPCAPELKLVVRSLAGHDVSAILLDVNRSDESRLFFEALRAVTDKPIIVRGVLADTEHVISYLEGGATDFIGRTTTPSVLAAKIQSFLRSLDPVRESKGIVQLGDVSIDLSNRIVMRGTDEVSLSPLEFRLLSVLAQNKGRACSHDELLRDVWGEEFANCSHYLRLYVGYLRQKLEESPRRPRMLLTEWGFGYRLAEPKLGRKRVRSGAALRLASSG